MRPEGQEGRDVVTRLPALHGVPPAISKLVEMAVATGLPPHVRHRRQGQRIILDVYEKLLTNTTS